MAWNVHTSLALNSWEPAQERAPIFEEDTGVGSLTLPITFRGTRAQLLDKFPFGKPVNIQGGTSMFCAGFASTPSQVPYTAEDPHWDVDLKLVGIHDQIPGQSGPYLSDTHALIVTAKWARRETNFPLTVQPEGGGDTIYVNPGPPIVPSGTSGNGLWKGRRIDHLPARNLTGIIISDTEPDPLHPKITLAVNAFPDPSPNLVKDYTSLLLDPVWVTFHGLGNQLQSAPATPGFTGTSGGAWCNVNFDVTRRLAPPGAPTNAKAIYFIQATWTWEQLRQPS